MNKVYACSLHVIERRNDSSPPMSMYHNPPLAGLYGARYSKAHPTTMWDCVTFRVGWPLGYSCGWYQTIKIQRLLDFIRFSVPLVV